MPQEHKLDASGLKCPMPILKAKKALSAINAGDILTVISTDSGSVKDFVAFCNQTNNTLISNTEEQESFIFVIKKDS